MKTKTILFRHRSAAGPYACADGEIESTVNVHLIPTSASYVSDDNDNGTDDYSANASPSLTPSLTPELTPELIGRLSTLLPRVEFALTPAPLAGWQNHPANPPAITADAPKSKDRDGWTLRAAETLERFHADADMQHLFTEPFLALVALRLKSGTHILPSSPVLLLPASVAPSVDGSDDFTIDSMTMTIRNAVCHRLRLRVTIPGSLEDYTEFIEAIDIFISSPIPLYDHDAPLQAVHRATGSSSPQSWLPQSYSDNEFTARLLSSATFHAISSLHLSGLTDDWSDVDFNIPGFSKIPELTKDDRLKELLSYTPGYLLHHGISAATACTFSGITTLTDLTLTLPTPPPLSTLIPTVPEAPALSNVALEIESVKISETLRAYAYDPAWPQVSLADSTFPKWLFLPDPDARQLSLITPEAIYVVPLHRHPLLDGSFYWCGSIQGRDISQTGVKKVLATVTLPTEKTLHRDSWQHPGTIRISDNGLTLTAAELDRLSRAPVMIAPIDPTLPIKIVTRPLKLASLLPETQKTGNDKIISISHILSSHWGLRLIGPFSGGLRLTFYGSRDLIHWYPLATTEDSHTNYSADSHTASCHPPTLAIPYTPALPYGRLVIFGSLSGTLEALLLLTP